MIGERFRQLTKGALAPAALMVAAVASTGCNGTSHIETPPCDQMRDEKDYSRNLTPDVIGLNNKAIIDGIPFEVTDSKTLEVEFDENRGVFHLPNSDHYSFYNMENGRTVDVTANESQKSHSVNLKIVTTCETK